MLGAETSTMLNCDRMATLSAVLLSNWVVLPVRKSKNMPYFFP